MIHGAAAIAVPFTIRRRRLYLCMTQAQPPSIMTAIAFPRLHCPFSSAIHPQVDECTRRTCAWLRETNLVSQGSSETRAVAARFGSLAARAYPWSSAEGLQLASDWATWLFMRDDICDEAELRADPAGMRDQRRRMSRILLEGGHDDADPLARALADLRSRIARLGGYEKLGRFIGPVLDYFEACVWEADNRALRRVPLVDEYLAMRRHTGSVLTCLTLADVTDDIRASLDAQQDARVRRLIDIANDVICWSNDIFSAQKEMRQGDWHNFVLLVKHAFNLDLATAIELVANKHDLIVREFELLDRRLPPDPRLRRFVDALKAWMRANYDWSLESGRYRAEFALAPDVCARSAAND